jgi:hypothetical protein
MSKPLVNLESIESIPTNNVKKSSEYDSILDSFIINNEPEIEVALEDDNLILLKKELEKRIKDRYLEDIVETLVIDDVLYLKK